MNNTIYDYINNHRSIRKYKNKDIPKDVLQRILNAGLRASSSGNMQAYSVIVTTDKEIRKELLPHHFHQEMVMQAPALITFCADFNRMRLWLKQNKAPENFDNFMSFLIAMIDATLASQNVALAAEAEGLGICYMGTTLASCDQISRVLNLPKQVVPVVGFSIGYPDEQPKLRDRLPLEGLVHYDTYQDYSEERISEIYKEKEVSGFKRYMDVPELKEKILEMDINNLAQVYTKLKYTKESHIGYSSNVMNCLNDQDFI